MDLIIIDSIPIPPHLPSSNSKQHIMTDQTYLTIIRGRTANSKNIHHIGFRYSKVGLLRKDDSQAWRSVKKNNACKGRS